MSGGPKSLIYHEQLAARDVADWDEYLLANSGLPGPRGNIELAQVAADLGTDEQFRHWLEWDAVRAPTNTPEEFLAFCGVIGLGRLAAEGQPDMLEDIRPHASDIRWRMREGVAMALQRIGRANPGALLAEMDKWAQGNWLERRAAAAGLCEPDLLTEESSARSTLDLLDRITWSVADADERGDDYKVLRQGLAYCWSVATAALPEAGKPLMERWMTLPDKDIRWIMRQNLKKNRLCRIDAAWVEKWAAMLDEADAASD